MMTAITKDFGFRANYKCVVICGIISMANLQYGLDTSIVGGLQAMPGFLRVFGHPDPRSPIKYGIDPTFQQLITSLMTLGAFLSSLFAGIFGNYFGRKTAIWCACLFNVVACTVLVATTNKGAVYFGRLLLGFSNGFLVTFSNIYVSELAPTHLRGPLVSLFGPWVSLGAIIGAVVNYATKTRLDKGSYQIPTACLYIVPLILSIGLFFIPESPRYLLFSSEEAKARKSLVRIRGTSTDKTDELEYEWAQMVRGIEEEKSSSTRADWIDMFRGTDLRRTLLCYGTVATQSASGIWFLVAYQTYFLQQGGVTKAFEYSIMASCVGFVGVIIGLYSQYHWFGRRSLLMFGAAAMGICQLAPAIAATSSHDLAMRARLLIAFISLTKMSFYIGIGSVCYPVATELVSTRLRAWTVGSATAINYVLAWLISFCSPYFINPAVLNWGAKYGYIWFGSNVICVAFYYFYIPEMKGRSLEELDEMFSNRVSVREFRNYQCTLSVEAQSTIKSPETEDKAEIIHLEATTKDIQRV